MPNRTRLPRFALFFTLLISLCAGMFSPRVDVAEAKPLGAAFGDVIISEVAWGGYAGDSGKEWIELYNPKPTPITLTGWSLVATDGSPSITGISGTIPAYGYFLLESSVNATPLDHDLTYSGTLSNTNETLTLKDGPLVTDNVIDTANSGCSGCWYAGSGSPDYLTMQRVGTLTDGPSAWVSGVGTPHNSKIDLELSIRLKSISGIAYPVTTIFEVIVENKGYGTATNIVVSDNLPLLGLSSVSFTSSSGVYDNNTGLWTINSLSTGSRVILEITATTNSLVTYSAQINAAQQLDPDSTPANSSTLSEDDDDLIRLGIPVLSISNTVNNLTPSVGSNVVFTIIVFNPGSDETGVVVDALLPDGLTYVSDNGAGAYVSSTGLWTIGNLNNGASATLNITAQVITASPVTFSAEVSSATYANNMAAATVTPIASTQADLSLSQTWTRSTTANDTAILNITVTNQDPTNAATSVQVRDLLPSGLTYVSHSFSASSGSTSGMKYVSSTGIWEVGTILGSGTATLSITVRAAPSGTSTTNFAEVWLADQFDIDSTPGNGDVGEDDSDSEEVLVSDLSLTQTSDIAGSSAVFTIRVTNSGPDDASNVKVKNSRLSVLTSYVYVSDAAPAGTTYDELTGIWNIGSLANGATVTLVVTTTLVSPDENLAEISDVREVDPDSLPDNKSRTEDDDAATPSADLSLTQQILSPAPYKNPDINTNVVFRLTVSNAGYAPATNVEVKNLLPAGLTYVSHTSGQTYNKSSGIWSVGSLSSGQSKTLDITAQVTAYGIRTNYAEVWKSDQSDPDSDPGDGSATEDDDDTATITSQRTVIINEIAWAGTAASAEDEWIELYNPSDTEITITGWKIRKNNCDNIPGNEYIVLSGKISKDGYFLLERGSTTTDNSTVSDVSANQIYLAGDVPALLDSGETLYLCDNLGNSVDTANLEGKGTSPNPWPAGSNTTNRPSMERLGNVAEKDSIWITNTGVTKNGTNASGGSIYGTPGRKNSTGISPTPTPIVPTATPITVAIPPRPIINEILARPGFDWNQDGKADVFDEFIEIKNLTAIDISLNGWKLDNFTSSDKPVESFTIQQVTLKPGERIIFYSKDTNLLLSDGGETVRLIDPSGKIYDAFTYDIARTEDQSFCRLPDGNPGNSWFEDCTPTPYLTNTREGKAPTSADGAASPVCNLPDTIPLDFFIPECNGYGANIWNPFYWDFTNWIDKLWIPRTVEKWRSFIE